MKKTRTIKLSKEKEKQKENDKNTKSTKFTKFVRNLKGFFQKRKKVFSKKKE